MWFTHSICIYTSQFKICITTSDFHSLSTVATGGYVIVLVQCDLSALAQYLIWAFLVLTVISISKLPILYSWVRKHVGGLEEEAVCCLSQGLQLTVWIRIIYKLCC